MRIKSVIAVAAITISGAFATGAGAETPSKLTIKPDAGGFTGKVKSADPSCLADRTVSVFKVTNSGAEKFASDTTDQDGEYSTGNNGQYKGKFYAKVKRSGECGGATSKTITLKK